MRLELDGPSYDRQLAAVTAIAIVVIGALALSPPVVLYLTAIVCFFAYIAGLLWLVSRDETPTDRYCSEMDIELDREEQERNARRHERQIQRTRTPRIALVRDHGSNVVRIFPPSDRGDGAA